MRKWRDTIAKSSAHMIFNCEIKLWRTWGEIDFWIHTLTVKIDTSSFRSTFVEKCKRKKMPQGFILSIAMVIQKILFVNHDKQSVLVKFVLKSTWVWDTFAEPNMYTIPSEAFIQNQASPFTGPRPKSRITEEGCGWRQLKTCLSWGSETPLQIQWILFFLRVGEKKWQTEHRTAQPPTLATFRSWGSSAGAGRADLPVRIYNWYLEIDNAIQKCLWIDCASPEK